MRAIAVLLGGLLAAQCGVVCLAQPITVFGLPHSPVGNATLITDSGTGSLTVGNLGSSGQDGVSVDLSGVQVPNQPFAWHATLGALGTMGDGSYIQSSAMAATSTGGTQLVSTIRGTQVGSNAFAITADFSPVSNGQPLTIDFYSGGPSGTLVYSEQYAGTTPQMICPLPFNSIYTDRTGAWWDVSKWTAGFDNSGPAFAMTTPDGTVLPASDNIDFVDIAAPSNLALGPYSSVAVTAGGGISSFSITGESVTVPEPSVVALLGVGAIGLLVQRRTSRGATARGDGRAAV